MADSWLGGRGNRMKVKPLPGQSVTARAPGKVILFGEHAVNRGQPALSAAVGLYASCTVTLREKGEYRFQSGEHLQTLSREGISELGRRVEAYRRDEDYVAIQTLGSQEYFAASQYILASAFGESLPVALDIEWNSEIPASSGLGSGGAAFTALVTALAPFLPQKPSIEDRADWAHRGDVIAHGGIASGLDTQTSLFGGIIRYTGDGLAETVSWHESVPLVIGNTGVFAVTSEVNGRVRMWLSQNSDARMAYFRTIGALERAALPLLRRGDWAELGSLLNLNQLVLEKIGVSCPECERLIEAALGAGAYGAKVSGSGGGGIIVALVSPDAHEAVAEAITQAGGTALTPDIGVEGASIS